MAAIVVLPSGHRITILFPNEDPRGRKGVWEVRVEGSKDASLASEGLMYPQESTYEHLRHHLAMDLMPCIGRKTVDLHWKEIEKELRKAYLTFRPTRTILLHEDTRGMGVLFTCTAGEDFPIHRSLEARRVVAADHKVDLAVYNDHLAKGLIEQELQAHFPEEFVRHMLYFLPIYADREGMPMVENAVME